MIVTGYSSRNSDVKIKSNRVHVLPLPKSVTTIGFANDIRITIVAKRIDDIKICAKAMGGCYHRRPGNILQVVLSNMIPL